MKYFQSKPRLQRTQFKLYQHYFINLNLNIDNDVDHRILIA